MEKNNQVTLEKIVEILRKNLLWIVIAGVLLGCISGVCGQLFIADEYTSEMLIILDTKDASGTDVSNLGYHTDRTVTYLSSPSAVKRAVVEAGVRVESADADEAEQIEAAVALMMGAISIRGDQETGSIVISVTSTSALVSYKVIRAYEELLPEIISEEGLMPIDILDMPSQAPSGPSNGGRAVKYGVFGMFAGLLIAVIVFIVRSFFDVIIRHEDDLKEAVDLPVLGQIPYYAVEVDGAKAAR